MEILGASCCLLWWDFETPCAEIIPTKGRVVLFLTCNRQGGDSHSIELTTSAQARFLRALMQGTERTLSRRQESFKKQCHL